MEGPVYVVASGHAVRYLARRPGLLAGLRHDAERARLARRPDVARDLEAFAAHLREASGAISGTGNSETVESEIGPESEHPVISSGVSVPAAAGLLGVSDRRVTQWLADGTLSGAKERGRWQVDRESVEQLRHARSSHGVGR